MQSNFRFLISNILVAHTQFILFENAYTGDKERQAAWGGTRIGKASTQMNGC